MREQFARMGVVIEEPEPDDDDAIEDDDDAMQIPLANLPSINAWCACETQWHVDATPHGLVWFGLRYADCRAVLDDLGSPPHVFADLRHMEAEALPYLNAREDG
ncbi:DUF1799 domain-containing protein [Ensifer soli]|uniref:DUF1799 domain-containing protein n=1 Tax=Ciceribacter sp. sgz301302 TaxID=3342379 RepID=UPI0035B7A42A